MERKTIRRGPPSQLSRAEVVALESRNALQQYDWAVTLIQSAIRSAQFSLTTEAICTLNRLAVQNLEITAGTVRAANVTIANTVHVPPDHEHVHGFLDDLVAYVSQNWASTSAVHLASYVMWRINWIHPFNEGNGRTSRMASYIVLNVKLGFLLPGTQTIPEQISADKSPYYAALDAADAAYKQDRIDVSAMENLTSELLAAQLLRLHDSATGSN